MTTPQFFEELKWYLNDWPGERIDESMYNFCIHGDHGLPMQFGT
jgi:hypothetical protein